jgi:hypothetical protein
MASGLLLCTGRKPVDARIAPTVPCPSRSVPADPPQTPPASISHDPELLGLRPGARLCESAITCRIIHG